jgi:hypothetical protein
MLGGDRRARNPILATFDEQAFPPEPLAIYVDPGVAVTKAEVRIQRGGIEVERRKNIRDLPVPFNLPPMEYYIVPTSPDYEPEQEQWSVELYEPSEQTVTFVPKTGGPPPPPRGTGPPSPPSGGEPSETTEAKASAKLIVEASDPIAPLEVTGNTGETMKLGLGRIEMGAALLE